MTTITTRALQSAQPKQTPYFIRDDKVKGFAAKVNPSGSIKLIAEVRHDGRTVRKTLGEYPHAIVSEARNQALSFMQQVRSGQLKKHEDNPSLKVLFEAYIRGERLKPGTLKLKDYRGVIFFYLQDWLEEPVDQITKQMIEKKFFQIRDKGINGGKPTYSQATKVMRILSALMNYARADEMIDSNPVEVLKLKRIDQSIKKRENYLPAHKVIELLSKTASEAHPVTLAVHLMLRTPYWLKEERGSTAQME